MYAHMHSYSGNVDNSVNAVIHLKSGKSGGEEGLNSSDHLINAPHRLIVILCQICTWNMSQKHAYRYLYLK